MANCYLVPLCWDVDGDADADANASIFFFVYAVPADKLNDLKESSMRGARAYAHTSTAERRKKNLM